jgi:hypothetical protein
VNRRWRQAAVVLMLVTAGVALAGCNVLGAFLSKTVELVTPEETVEAQYDLHGMSVLVLVDTKDATLASDYPRLESAMSEAVGKVLAEHQACGPIVPVRSLEAARQAEVHFDDWSVAQAGKYFNVDIVLHIEMFEFRLKDNPNSTAYQGYAEAAVRLVSPETGQQVWPVLSDARSISAETQPDVEAEQTGQQEAILIDGFAEKIARLFFTYKKDDLPMRPKVK